MDFLDNFASFLNNFIRVFLTMLGTNSRNGIFPFLTSAIVTCLFVRVLFKRGK